MELTLSYKHFSTMDSTPLLGAMAHCINIDWYNKVSVM